MYVVKNTRETILIHPDNVYEVDKFTLMFNKEDCLQDYFATALVSDDIIRQVLSRLKSDISIAVGESIDHNIRVHIYNIDDPSSDALYSRDVEHSMWGQEVRVCGTITFAILLDTCRDRKCRSSKVWRLIGYCSDIKFIN
jgi:hypothetical protein